MFVMDKNESFFLQCFVYIIMHHCTITTILINAFMIFTERHIYNGKQTCLLYSYHYLIYVFFIRLMTYIFVLIPLEIHPTFTQKFYHIHYFGPYLEHYFSRVLLCDKSKLRNLSDRFKRQKHQSEYNKDICFIQNRPINLAIKSNKQQTSKQLVQT